MNDDAAAVLSADSKPAALFTGYLRHLSGVVKEVEVIARDGNWLIIWWPTAGLYEVNIKSGRLKGGKRRGRWSMDASEVSRCIRELQGRAKRLHMQIERPGER